MDRPRGRRRKQGLDRLEMQAQNPGGARDLEAAVIERSGPRLYWPGGTRSVTVLQSSLSSTSFLHALFAFRAHPFHARSLRAQHLGELGEDGSNARSGLQLSMGEEPD